MDLLKHDSMNRYSISKHAACPFTCILSVRFVCAVGCSMLRLSLRALIEA